MTPAKALLSVGAALVAGGLIAACSDGLSGAGTTPMTATNPAPRRRGTAEIVIRIPRRPHRRADYISPSTKSMTVAVAGEPLQTFDLTTKSHDCVASSSAGLTCSVHTFLPAGEQSVTIALYDRTGGRGHQLAAATTTVKIADDAVTTISITLDGVVASATVLLDGSSTVTVPQGTPTSIPLTVTAYDADHNVIMSPGTYAPAVSLSDGDTSGSTALSSKSASAPGAALTLAYNGGAISSATITPSVGGTPLPAGAATLKIQPLVPITEYSLPVPVYPVSITPGPDGALWFTGYGFSNNIVGKITTDGSITTYSASGSPFAIAATTGNTGPIWFSQLAGNAISAMTFSGSTPSITSYSIPTKSSHPKGVALGPDGATWFTECTGHKIGRLSDGTINEYTTSSSPVGITTGPDGALWFAEARAIGRITTAGAMTSYSLAYDSAATAITTGSDGGLWFTDSGCNAIGRITTGGAIKEFTIPTPNSDPQGITGGPDGALWFTESQGNNIGRITTTGEITEFPIPTGSSSPGGITAGPDGAIWFTECNADKIGRMVPPIASQARRRRSFHDR